jgi:hypothetical protein
MSGDFANGVETVVADHVVSHMWKDTYLLWFDDQLTPHLRPSKLPTAAELAMAKWGIGGQGVWLWDGKVWPGSSRTADSRTAIAIDRERRLLFLGVGDNISPRLMLQKTLAKKAQAKPTPIMLANAGAVTNAADKRVVDTTTVTGAQSGDTLSAFGDVWITGLIRPRSDAVPGGDDPSEWAIFRVIMKCDHGIVIGSQTEQSKQVQT